MPFLVTVQLGSSSKHISFFKESKPDCVFWLSEDALINKFLISLKFLFWVLSIEAMAEIIGALCEEPDI